MKNRQKQDRKCHTLEARELGQVTGGIPDGTPLPAARRQPPDGTPIPALLDGTPLPA